MAILKCKMCGGELEITEETSVCECEYCGSKQTIPTVDDEKIMKLYDRANRLRMANEFDKAAGVYESIIAESDTEAEAYWGLLLCKFGIEYVDDPATGDKVPTCHRSSFDSIMEDSDFEMVMENADGISRNVYREQAKQIEEIRKGIIEVSGKEEPYDIFICYKETAEDGDRTIDSVMAQNIYDQLTAKGYRVFFSRITLEDKLGQEYEPYIFAALNSAKIMLAFGTDYDYYNAVWVKNEWSRYLKLMAKDKSKKLIPCYKGIDAYDIPKEFKHLQAQDMGKVGADQDLIRGIDKILRPEGSGKGASANVSASNVQDIQAAVASAVAANTGSNMSTLLERGFMTLEDGDFDKADSLFEDVLNQNPKCAEAYMGKLMAYYQAKNITKFVEQIFEGAISEYDEVEIEPDFDMKDIILTKYTLGSQFSDEIIGAVRDAFCFTYKTNIDSLQNFDAAKDYVEVFCGLDNDSKDNSSQLDDRYYARYKQYATDEVKARFNISSLLSELVATKLQEEENRVSEIKKKYSKEGLEEILELANAHVKEIVGDELDQIEAKYQAELKEWEDAENAKKAAYEKECQEIKENWPAKRAEIQNAWKTECERLTAEYNAKKSEYDAEKARVEANNNHVRNMYNQAKSDYENEIKRIDSQISSMRTELAGLGLFKGKQKEALNQNIAILESKKNAMVAPVLASFGSLVTLPQELDVLQLPPQPLDSEEPVYPEKPVQAEKPERDECSTKVDGVDELCVILEDKDIETYYIKEEYEEELKRLEKDRVEREFSDICKRLKIKYRAGIITYGIGPDKNPLEWRVLVKNGNEALLVTKQVIDVVEYNEKYEDTTWEKCTLRAYLNNDFIKNTFSSEEQERIKQVKLKNKDNEEYGTFGGNDTTDKVFCLSIDEVNEYFFDDEDRVAIPTKYAKGKVSADDMEYFMEESSGGGLWWLRSPGNFDDNAAYVDGSGWVSDSGSGVDFDLVGIRPALWLNLDS